MISTTNKISHSIEAQLERLKSWIDILNRQVPIADMPLSSYYERLLKKISISDSCDISEVCRKAKYELKGELEREKKELENKLEQSQVRLYIIFVNCENALLHGEYVMN